jgi:DNA-binding transcriptional ArsR family regulator
MSPAITAKLVEVLDSSFLRALAEPSRLEILKVLLEQGPSDVGTIAARVPQERSVVSRHLKVLLDAQIVTGARRGRHRVFAVDGQAILVRFERILALARSVAAVCCPPGVAVIPAGDASGGRRASSTRSLPSSRGRAQP